MVPRFRRAIARIAVVLAALAGVAHAWSSPPPHPAVEPAHTAGAGQGSWIVSPETARRIIADGALVLDARPPILRGLQPLPGAVPVRWSAFSLPDPPGRGLLRDDASLTRHLQALGVRADVPVVVVGDPASGWGEDGRIVWMLRTLGHQRTVMVDGGVPALLSGGAVRIHLVRNVGDFVVRRDDSWFASIGDVRNRLAAADTVIVDVRDGREFAGATPHGESRGGHLPGARHIEHRDLLGADGRLLPAAQLRTLLARRGIDGSGEVIAYCTGGVRAAWFAVVLQDLGFRVRTYAGSMWEWSAADPAHHPLAIPVPAMSAL